MNIPRRALALLATLLLLGVFGCDGDKPAPSETASPSSTSSSSSSPAPSAPVPAMKALELVVAYGSEKKTWLEEQAATFAKTAAKTKSGRPIVLKLQAMGSGEAAQAIVSGELKAHVFSPASALYVSVLNDAYSRKSGRPKAISPAGEQLVLSPIVVAMWKPMAEALGWPNKPIGWSDLLKVDASPKGWGGFGRPEWGRFKLGHTHPEYSNSGLQAIVAEAYAGAKKTRGLTLADLDAKATQATLSSIEQTIVHYGKSTGFFADKMLERGPQYLSAAVLYENLVIESYSKSGAAFPVVAVYPVEGTFWSDHPYAVLDADWVGPDEREAADAFLRFLKSKPAQERALALGFRPADASIPIGAPIDEAHGVDPKQPQTLLEIPSGPVLEKLIEVWRKNKKTSDVELVLDKSGSMNGKPLEQAKAGAKAFLDVLKDEDDVSVIFFDGELYPTIGPKPLGKAKKELVERIDGLTAGGDTALYDAVARAFDEAKKRAQASPTRIHAVVVMTDGKDEGSKLKLDELLKRFAGDEATVKVFTIAYGDGADPKVLQQIADAAKGTSVQGNTATIVDVFRDMAAFF